ncbi:MAG: sugar transferase, partial [bacterium]
APFVYGHVARTGVFVERGYVPLVIGFLAFLLFMLLRLVVFRAIHRTMVRRGYWASRVLVVGRGEVGEKVSKWMSESDQSSLRFAGFVHFKSGEGRPARGLVESAVKQRQADEVIVAVPDLSHQEMLEIKDCCGDGGIRVSFVSNLFKTLCEKVDLSRIEGVPLLELKNGKRGMLGLAAKRLLDLGASTFLILFLSPLLLAFGLIIRHTSPGPAMFRQRRIGLNGRTFTLYKFRTMYDKADSGDNIHKHFVSELIRDGSRERPSYKIVEDPRVTRIGRWLRRTSLDELLQIFNVFKGDMSLVGPRPALPYELESYQKWHRKRLTVRPGITGLWQVAGRSGVPFDEMVLMDVYYIENWSLWMDMSLVLKTIPAVLSGRGAY